MKTKNDLLHKDRNSDDNGGNWQIVYALRVIAEVLIDIRDLMQKDETKN